MNLLKKNNLVQLRGYLKYTLQKKNILKNLKIMEEPAAPAAPGLPPPPSIVRPDVPITKRVITTLERMVKQSDRDVPWEDILAFYQMFDKPFDEEAEQIFRKRFNPENVPQIKFHCL